MKKNTKRAAKVVVLVLFALGLSACHSPVDPTHGFDTMPGCGAPDGPEWTCVE